MQYGERKGPMSEQEIEDLIDLGSILPDDLVWSESMPDWVPARSHFPFRRRSVAYDDYDFPRPRRQSEHQAGHICGILACIFGGIAFLFCPPLFGIAGLVLGIISVCLCKDKTLGIVGIVLSVIGAGIGMIIGIAISSSMRM